MPLSPAFPAPELLYILEHSEASLLLSSDKFAAKAREVMALALLSKPNLVELAKFQGGASHEKVELECADAGPGGMMLYTSGTTSRPVSDELVFLGLFQTNNRDRKALCFLNVS